MFDFDQKVVIVTGGTRGIGLAASRLFHRMGARVIASYHGNATAAGQLEKECVGLRTFGGDLGLEGNSRQLIALAFRWFGKVDVLINNAGIWSRMPAGSGDAAAWDRMMESNLRSVYLVTDALVSRWLKAGDPGCIVNISSTAGQRGEAEYAHYAATKGAIIAYTKSLGAELASRGIRVNAVAPGWVQTDMTAHVLTGENKQRIEAGIPLGRIPQPDEIAWPIVFLASDLASAIVGEILNVNAGGVLCG